MRRRTLLAIAAAAISMGATGISHAQQQAVIDAGAITALEKMSAYLRTLTVFQVRAATVDEDVLDDGQKIQYSGTADILFRKPGNLRAEVANDRFERMYLYDGGSFTLYAKRLNYYATLPAPPTIGQLADTLADKHGFSIPLEDLFRWGASVSTFKDIKSAIVVGPSVVDGATCEQYAFSQDDIDWQIWIQLGEYPLPRRLVIATKTDAARPEHTVSYTWNLAPSFNDASFKFDPPPGAQRVVVASAVAGAK